MSTNKRAYPHNRLVRGILRGAGRLILPLLFRIEIDGKENLPRSGPVILVGNHNAAIEAALMVVYAPWQVEMLGAGDIPQEKLTEFFEALYQYIPIRRGHVDRGALQSALDVLKQGGVLGIFPEGGVWNPGQMRAQTGVSWLSYRAKTPVLPIGFGGTANALTDAARFKRPKLTIRYGELIPAAKLSDAVPRKVYFEQYAEEVMMQVRALLPPDDPARSQNIRAERFALNVQLTGPTLPAELEVQHGAALAKLFHRPIILRIFRFNLQLPVEALEHLDQHPTPGQIRRASEHILSALEGEYPYLLTYRFGPKEADDMFAGLKELHALAHWAETHGAEIQLEPVWHYYDLNQAQEITQIRQTPRDNWM